MSLVMKPAEGFRAPFSVRNSDAAIMRFPFPFRDDKFMYSVNLEPHGGAGAGGAYDAYFDIDEHYLGDVGDRAIVLAEDGLRCQVMGHLGAAEWETLALLMESLAKDFPEHFGLERDGDCWRWVNRALGVDQRFRFGDAGSLPCGALEYITRQAQGDFVLLSQRDENLWLEGGMVTSQSDWSLNFDLGMNFHEWHGPVPVAHELGVFDRALAALLRLKAGRPVRRVNWAVTINPRLDVSTESYPVWGGDKRLVTAGNVGEMVWLRVELQTLTRLGRSGAILFSIRAYLLRLDELARVGAWAARTHRVLRGLDPEIAAYKGLTALLPLIVGYLAPLDDGRVLPARGQCDLSL